MASASRRHDLDRERVLYLVPYAHLDTQWRWDYRTTIRRYLKETLDQNANLIETYPHYVFNFSGAIRYQMIEEYYPEAFERLKDHVAAGRWLVAGCQVEEADAIVPSPESMIRQILYGRRYFERAFDRAPVDYMLPDCFGFPWFQPSVLAHCGLEGFSTQKLTWQSAAGIPFPVGMWEGPDGESVAAALDPGMYVGRVRMRPERNPWWVRRLIRNGKESGVWADYRYYGTGDVGGAPKERSVRTVERSLEAQEAQPGRGAITIHQGASDQMFRDLTAAQRRRLPRYSGDLLLTRHSAGSLTSQAMIKRWNRKNELLADAAERLAVIATQLGAAYPMDALRKAWLRVLGSQMHDILPGTSLPRCYDYAHNNETVAANALAGALIDAAGALAACMDTTCAEGEVRLLVYNPLAFARQDVVEASVPLRAPAAVQVTGPDGQPVPAQILSRTEDETRVLFLADLPPCGAAAFAVVAADARANVLLLHDSGLRVERGGLENDRYRVTLNEEGQVTSIVDKAAGERELLSGPIEHQFLRESPRIFPAWNMEWRDRIKPPMAVLGGPAQIEVVERGPVRVSVRITRAHGSSRFEQEVRLACGNAGNRIEFADTIDWRETGCSFKAAFPLSVSAPEAAYNWELGVICRGNNDPAKFEVPAHRWFDLSDPDGEYGVTVLEDCKYGSDKPADDVLRLTLLFTPRVGPLQLVFRDQGSQDWGRHRMRYGLYGHEGDWRAGGSERQALRFNQPLRAFHVPRASGGRGRPGVPHAPDGLPAPSGLSMLAPLGKTFSFLQLDSEQVGVRAIKQAEDRETIVVRVQELWGQQSGEVTLSLAAEMAGGGDIHVWETDGCERRLRQVEGREGRFTFKMGPFAIRTFEVQLPPRLADDGRAATDDGRRDSRGARQSGIGGSPLKGIYDSPAEGATPSQLRPQGEGGVPSTGPAPGSTQPHATLERGVPASPPRGAPLVLPYNLQAFTGDEERARGALPGGRSYPRELVPARVTCCGVPLEMAVDQAQQAVSCQGQVIDLPPGAFDTLLLLAAADEDRETTLRIDGMAHCLQIQGGEGFVGLWDRRLWDRPMEQERDYVWRAKVVGLEPGYIKRDRIGWYTTHMHSAEGNEPYAYGYAFLYAVPLPPDARTLTLPDDPGVRIFAATACRGALRAEPAAPLYDELPFRMAGL